MLLRHLLCFRRLHASLLAHHLKLAFGAAVENFDETLMTFVASETILLQLSHLNHLLSRLFAYEAEVLAADETVGLIVLRGLFNQSFHLVVYA